MKLQPLYDLQQEVNRLFIAGGKFAKDDPRILKLIPVFGKLGEKAPVFRKIASDLEDLIRADVRESAEKLSAISTLLYSVLYTQGETTESDAEDMPQQPDVELNDVNTNLSHAQLKPVIEALTVTRSGRLELLKDARERKVFEDSRTFHYLAAALGDKYAELADYVEKTVIPEIGKPVVPFLLRGFTLEDKTENVRKLRLLNLFGYERLRETVDAILADPLPNLQAEAVNILSNDPANESLIIRLADDRNKSVREAAWHALARLNTRNSLEKLKEAYLKNKNKANLPALAGALASTRLPFFFQEVFDRLLKTREEVAATDAATDNKTLVDKLDRFATEILILKNKDDAAVDEFFNELFGDKRLDELLSSKKNELGYSLNSLTDSIIACLNSFGNERALSFYSRNGLDMPNAEWKAVFCRDFLRRAVDDDWSQEKIYDLFSPAFAVKLIGVEDLHGFSDRMDSRWLEHVYATPEGKSKWEHGMNMALQIIDAREPDNCERFNKLLTALVGQTGQNDAVDIYELMMKREVPGRFETIFGMVSKIRKSAGYYYFYRLQNSKIWERFPKDYAPKFKELFEKTKVELFEKIAETIQSTKN